MKHQRNTKQLLYGSFFDIDSFIEEVHKTYPEIELEVVPYSGANTTTCLQNMLEADDLPDICTQTL